MNKQNFNKQKFSPLIALLFVFVTGIISCKRGSTCYSADLYLKYNNTACPLDCPGVTGCDGNAYCNECEANRQGIRVKK